LWHDEELIDRIGAWEEIKAWAEAGQSAGVWDVSARRCRVAMIAAAFSH
jgi:hypothetical protein